MKAKKVLPCVDVLYLEFPDILIGKSLEDELYYFDATRFLQLNENFEKNAIEDFRIDMKRGISVLSTHYSIPPEDMIVMDLKTSHILMEVSLTLLFLAYIDSSFLIYSFEELSRLLQNGFAISDSMLIALTKDKFTKKDIDVFFAENPK